MKNFRSTIIFALVAGALVFFAYRDFEKNKDEQADVAKKDLIFPELKKEDVTELAIYRPGSEGPAFHFKKGGDTKEEKKKESDADSVGGEWKMLKPVEDEADGRLVENFVQQILDQKLQELSVDKENVDDKKYALEDPIKFELTANGKTHTFFVSTEAAFDGSRYIKKEANGGIYIGEKRWSNLADKPANDLREKQLYKAEGTPETIEVSGKAFGGKALKLVRKGTDWSVDGKPDIKLDNAKVGTWLDGMETLRTTSFLAEDKEEKTLREYGLHRPEGTIRLDDWEMKFATKSANIYVITNQRNTVFRLNESDRNQFVKELKDLRDLNYPFDFDASQANELAFKTPKETVKVVRNSDTWKLADASVTMEADQSQVQKLLDDIGRLEVASFEGKTSFKPANHQITLKAKDGSLLYELMWGKKIKRKDTEFYLAKSSVAGETLAIEAAPLDAIAGLVLKKAKPESPDTAAGEKKQK